MIKMTKRTWIFLIFEPNTRVNFVTYYLSEFDTEVTSPVGQVPCAPDISIHECSAGSCPDSCRDVTLR